MDCRDYETAWNDRLDARGAAAAADPDPALEAHAAACPACRALGTRYLLLTQALRGLAPPPAPPAGFADRVLAAASAPSPAVVPFRARLIRLAAAAAVVAAVGLAARVWTSSRVGPVVPPVAGPVAPPAPDPAADAGDLSEALAEATSATFDLARSASAPAARVGSQVLAAADLPAPPAGLTGADLDVDLAASGTGPGPVSEAIEAVGARVSEGVRPLGGTARSAFSFLLGPEPEAPSRPDDPTAPKRGA